MKTYKYSVQLFDFEDKEVDEPIIVECRDFTTIKYTKNFKAKKRKLLENCLTIKKIVVSHKNKPISSFYKKDLEL